MKEPMKSAKFQDKKRRQNLKVKLLKEKRKLFT